MLYGTCKTIQHVIMMQYTAAQIICLFIFNVCIYPACAINFVSYMWLLGINLFFIFNVSILHVLHV